MSCLRRLTLPCAKKPPITERAGPPAAGLDYLFIISSYISHPLGRRNRWAQIKKDFLRNKALGGDSADTGAKVVVQLADVVEGLNKLALAVNNHPFVDNTSGNRELIEAIEISSIWLKCSLAPSMEVINQPLPRLDKVLKVLADSLKGSLVPLVRNMDKKLDID